MKTVFPIGLLYSRSGDYAVLADAARTGVLEGIDAVNADPARSVTLNVVERDPSGDTSRYAPLCADLLRTPDARHVFGCTTSWSRKEVIPVLERHEGMLWYSAPYEGFETSEHVVYTHACPNQHIVPLLAYALPRFGAEAFLVGSNYIWGWEVNRVARDLVGDAGGRVLGERYLPLGETAVDHLVAAIVAARPSFVLNNLVGSSSYAFLDAYARLGQQDPEFAPARRPILSCNLIEPELAYLTEPVDGHLSVGPFFAPPGKRSSSFAAAAHAAVLMLADAVEVAGSGDPRAIRRVLGERTFATPLGPMRIDPRTQHATLPVQIARIEGASFHPIWASEGVLEPDPYLSRYDPRAFGRRKTLRVVA